MLFLADMSAAGCEACEVYSGGDNLFDDFQHFRKTIRGDAWGDIDGRPASVISAWHNRKSSFQILDGLSERLVAQKDVRHHSHLACYVSGLWHIYRS